MKKAVPPVWSDLLNEISDPKTDQKVDIASLLSMLIDDRAKHYQTYTRNALAYCITQFMDKPGLTEKEQDFYRGAAMAYRSMMNLRVTLEKQVGGQEVVKKKAENVGDAGY